MSYVESFATNLSPVGEQTITENPVFEWTGVDKSGVKYDVELYDEKGI